MITHEQILRNLEIAGSDNLNRFGGKFEGGIYLQQSPHEFASLIIFLLGQNNPPETYLEIGSAEGGSIRALNQYLKFKKIVLVDDNKHKSSYMRNSVLREVAREEIIGDSHSSESVDKVKQLNIEFDLLMVDADPTYNGMKTDITLYTPLLKKDGILVIHNIVESSCRDVRRIDKELSEGYLGFKKIHSIIEIENRLGLGIYAR